MAAARIVKGTPGYEPAKGFPDPQFQRTPEPPAAPGVITHLPRLNGPACGAPASSNAGAYSPTRPTCPWCANYLAETQKTTAEMHGSAPAPAPAAPTTPAPAAPAKEPSK